MELARDRFNVLLAAQDAKDEREAVQRKLILKTAKQVTTNNTKPR
jgi:hypothetical protein